ncbi:MAG: alpha/beta hydrolase [Anaerolineae bacterium]|nr:alpha/beta hydrolase [Anaerolineae bacterium]
MTGMKARLAEQRQDAIGNQEEMFAAHRIYDNNRPLFPQSNDMEFMFHWGMGYTTNGGGAPGEFFYAINQIEQDGDPVAWEREFEALARRVEARADASMAKRHRVSAREAYMRAATYYRSVMGTLNPYDAKWAEMMRKMRHLFTRAGKMFDPPIQYIEIPFQGAALTGYYWPADHRPEKKPTLMMFGGGETFAEDQYWYIGPHAHARGWNFVTFDLPGQGDLPQKGMFFRPDTETPMKAIVDWVLTRPEVDPDRLAAYGISAGGYLIPRAACYEKRIKACIGNSILQDLGRIFANTPVKDVKIMDDKIFEIMANLLAWRWGLKEAFELIDANKDFVFDPKLITCPLMSILGEGEGANKELLAQNQKVMAECSNPNKVMVVLPLDEGAAHHCQGTNTALMASAVFDWLEETFGIE